MRLIDRFNVFVSQGAALGGVRARVHFEGGQGQAVERGAIICREVASGMVTAGAAASTTKDKG